MYTTNRNSALSKNRPRNKGHGPKRGPSVRRTYRSSSRMAPIPGDLNDGKLPKRTHFYYLEVQPGRPGALAHAASAAADHHLLVVHAFAVASPRPRRPSSDSQLITRTLVLSSEAAAATLPSEPWLGVIVVTHIYYLFNFNRKSIDQYYLFIIFQCSKLNKCE